jgi:uncharacterized membrane protein YozB (DUF420 family)
MKVKEVVDDMDTAMNVVAFVIMSMLTGWTLIKYRKYQKDKFFVFSLCMYPFAYFLLAIATLSYFWAENEEDND